ncbi:MAG TPA: RING finger family 4 domain-containing protein, partial [Micromonospora sp.]
MSRLVTETPPAVQNHPLARVLLGHGLVAPHLLASGKVKQRRSDAPPAAGLRALEADLLTLGFLLGPRLRGHLAGLDARRLATVGFGLLAEAGRLVGGHVPHVPLFRSFPRRVPADTEALFVDRVFALLLQQPEQPCVLCGLAGCVHPVSPCAHLVCRACWDGSDYSACPICHRRLSLGDPFLTPAPPRRGTPALPVPRRAARRELVDDLAYACHQLTVGLLGRRLPLTGQQHGELKVLLDQAGSDAMSWLPEEIPVRETRAAVLARFVADPATAERVPELLDRYVDTATDALRLLYALSGGDPGLVTPPPRRRSLTRRLRRAILCRLDRLPLPALVEDLHRHRGRWLSTAENLHPFEEANRHPAAATAFAALRGTVLDEGTGFGRLVAATAARHPAALARVDTA